MGSTGRESNLVYVCICHGITDRQIRRAVDQGARTLSEVRKQLPVAACCGRCGPAARELIRNHADEARQDCEAAYCAAAFAR